MRFKGMYTWDELCDRAKNGKDEPKEEAKWSVKCYALAHGNNIPNRFQHSEDAVAEYCEMWKLFFDENGNIIENNSENKVRKYVKSLVKPYEWKYDTIEMVSFALGEHYFSYDSENVQWIDADFQKVIIITEKRWLLDLIKDENENINTDEEAIKFLKEQYTYDDSNIWFNVAREEGKIIAVDFV